MTRGQNDYIYEMYDVDRFIRRCISLDFPELLGFVAKKREENSNKRKDSFEHLRARFCDFVHEFSFFLQSGIKPFGMSDSDFQKTKPIIEKLVEKGQFNDSVLKNYK